MIARVRQKKEEKFNINACAVKEHVHPTPCSPPDTRTQKAGLEAQKPGLETLKPGTEAPKRPVSRFKMSRNR